MIRTSRWPFAGRLAAWCAPPALVLALMWQAFGGTAWNSRIPLLFGGDALFYLAQSKSTLDHGWWWFNPSLSVPTGYDALVFAQNTNVDQTVVWIVGLFTSDVGQAVNLAWLAMLALSAVTATWGLRRLGVSPLGAGVAGVLFGLSPFAIYRSLGHLNVVTWLVPFPATVAVMLAAAGPDRVWRWKELAIPVAGCLLLGFNYIYNAFFGAALVAAGLLIGFGRTRSRSLLFPGAACLGAIVLATALNLVPNQLAWQEHGQPRGVQHRALESDLFGLKIRHLITPVTDHWFPPFQTWLARDAAARFPFETESVGTRLGVVAASGWLALMAGLVLQVRRERARDEDAIPAAARLSLAVVLLATIGGFGSLFSLLLSSDIRAYNRISPFLTFFALVAVAIWIDRLTRARPARLRAMLWTGLLVLGIADQRPALNGLLTLNRGGTPVWQAVTTFVTDLERKLPEGAAVFQLPVRPFPADPGVERMGVYDHFRPYLASRDLRWSYPALTAAQFHWEESLVRRPESEWPAMLKDAGFSAILINRTGYADGGESVARALRDAAAGATPLAADDMFIALDLRR